MVCTTGLVKYVCHIFGHLVILTKAAFRSISRQVVITAKGEIATTSCPGEFDGQYQESVTGSTSIPIVAVQDVGNLRGQEGRLLEERNVTCGFEGPGNVVYILGSCPI